MLVSVFALASCENETATESTPADNSDGSNAESSEVKELTPKELFAVSLENVFTGGSESSGAIAEEFNGKDYVTTVDMEVTELLANGMDITETGEIKMNYVISSDLDKKILSETGTISLFGETLPVGIVMDSDGTYYITDLFALNDKPIRMAMDYTLEDGTDISGAIDTAANYEAIYEHIIKSVEKVVDESFDESVYSIETKDVTVEGTEVKGAQIVTLTLNGEKITDIANSLIDELLKNEDIKALLGEGFDTESEITNEISDGLKSIVITNTVSDETTVALDVVVNYIETDYETEEEKECTFAVKSALVESGFSLTAGFLDGDEFIADEGYITAKATKGNGKYEFVISVTDDIETQTVLSVKAEGTETDSKFDGTVTAVLPEENEFSFKLVAEYGETTGKVAIRDIVLTQSGEKTELPVSLSVVYTAEENKITYGGTVSIEAEGEMSMTLTMNCVTEFKDVTLESVTDYVDMEDIDGDALLAELATKYPTFYSLINSMGGMEGEAYEEEF